MGKLARINAERRVAEGRSYANKTMEQFDGFAALRNGLRRLATERKEWAGYPMPLQDNPLVVEPSYPLAKELMSIGRDPAVEEEDKAGRKVRNAFWSTQRRSTVYIWNEGDRIEWGTLPGVHHISHDIRTLGASDVWGIEQEHNAVQLLGSLVEHRVFKQYLLTGMFIEASPRSGVHYLFRRLKPTVAIRLTGKGPRILAALCMHPIAYYEGSWAGAMTPTDDIVAHLMLMRGDEVMFWRRCNQHAPYRPEAGL